MDTHTVNCIHCLLKFVQVILKAVKLGAQVTAGRVRKGHLLERLKDIRSEHYASLRRGIVCHGNAVHSESRQIVDSMNYAPKIVLERHAHVGAEHLHNPLGARQRVPVDELQQHAHVCGLLQHVPPDVRVLVERARFVRTRGLDGGDRLADRRQQREDRRRRVRQRTLRGVQRRQRAPCARPCLRRRARSGSSPASRPARPRPRSRARICPPSLATCPAYRSPPSLAGARACRCLGLSCNVSDYLCLITAARVTGLEMPCEHHYYWIRSRFARAVPDPRDSCRDTSDPRHMTSSSALHFTNSWQVRLGRCAARAKPLPRHDDCTKFMHAQLRVGES
jgi:hypothetical protein